MKIAMLAPTIAPLTSIGGLGDVMRDLSKYLVREDNKVVVLTPDHYGKISKISNKEIYNFQIMYNGAPLNFKVLEVIHPTTNVKIIAFSNEQFNKLDMWDSVKYEIFSEVVLKYLEINKVDCVSGHDWASGLAIAKCHDILNLPTTITIHNEAFKGPIVQYNNFVMTFLELGVKFSDAFNTVSPTHSEEIKSIDFINEQSNLKPFHGILNGIDFENYNSMKITERMSYLCNKLNPKDYGYLENYGPFNALHVKPKIRESWLYEEGINKYIEQWNNIDKNNNSLSGTDVEIYGKLNKQNNNVPLFGMVGRATNQKGFDITLQCFSEILEEHSVQLIMLAKGDEKIEKQLGDFAESYSSNVMSLIGHCMPLTSIIYSSSNWTLAPSLWEPCGLVQIESMAHCTPVIGREIGGLKDTIIPLSPDPINSPNFHEATGVLFKDYNKDGLKWGVEHALNWTYYKIKELCIFLEYSSVKCPEHPLDKGSPLECMMKNCYNHTLKNLSWENNNSVDKYKGLFGGAIYTHNFGNILCKIYGK